MKKTRSLFALLLVFLMAMPMTAFAADITDNSLLLTEANGVRTAITIDNTTEYTVVYDQNNSTISYSERNLQTDNVTSSGDVEIENRSSISPKAVTISKDTHSGFKYTKWTGTQNKWDLQRPRNDGTGGRYYFRIWQNATNKSEVGVFETAVNLLANKEATYIALTTTADMATLGAAFAVGLAVASGGALAPAAIAALVAAAGATGAAYAAGVAVGTQCNPCMSAIEAVYYATDNMHF